ncbi:MAG: type II secretion system F family protein [Candidatus Bilamarchaeaceae archaeon]
MLLKNLAELSQNFPEIEVKSKLLEPLEKLYPQTKTGKYFTLSLTVSIIFFILILLLLLAASNELTDALTYSIFSGLIIFLFLISLPSFELKTKTKKMEAEMPFLLRTIGMLRNMKIPFIRCLAMAAEEESEMAEEIKKIINDVNRGITLEKSFSRFATLFSSYSIKRALAQILSAYEVGSSGTEMKRIGDELLAVQQHELRESASKNAIFGMLFIMTTAILPTFFIIYVLVGNYSGGTFLDDLTIALALLIVFPAISAALLLLSKSMVPYSPLMPKKSAPPVGLIIGAGLFIISSLLNDSIINVVGVLLGLIIMGASIYKDYKKEKRIEEIEQYLPDALFSIAALPKSAKIEKIFEVMASGGYKALSEEAIIAKRQLNTNINTDKVLEDFWKRNESPALKKVCMMIKHAYDTNSVEQLHFIAEDILKNFEIKRERAALMSMQKYTILFGGLIIPFILKISLSLIGSIATFIIENSTIATAKLNFITSLIPAYLIIYALIASLYVADIEGRKSRGAVYFVLLSFASMLVFTFVNF